jgi:hypothetical protein
MSCLLVKSRSRKSVSLARTACSLRLGSSRDGTDTRIESEISNIRASMEGVKVGDNLSGEIVPCLTFMCATSSESCSILWEARPVYSPSC